MEVIEIPSNKNKIKLCVNGYIYTKEKTNSDTSYWICENRVTHLCKGRMVTKYKDTTHIITKSPTEHTHTPLAYQQEVYKSNAHLKRKAQGNYNSPSQIVLDTKVLMFHFFFINIMIYKYVCIYLGTQKKQFPIN